MPGLDAFKRNLKLSRVRELRVVDYDDLYDHGDPYMLELRFHKAPKGPLPELQLKYTPRKYRLTVRIV